MLQKGQGFHAVMVEDELNESGVWASQLISVCRFYFISRNEMPALHGGHSSADRGLLLTVLLFINIFFINSIK